MGTVIKIKVPTTTKCTVCERKSINSYSEPIEYQCCRICKTVFVKGNDGTISVLDNVEYKPDEF